MEEHLVAGYTVLLNIEYLTRHNKALMILAVTWVKEHKLIEADSVVQRMIGVRNGFGWLDPPQKR